MLYISNSEIFERAVHGADCHDAVFYKQSKSGVSESGNKLPKRKENRYVPEEFAHHEQLNKFELNTALYLLL